MWCFHILHIHHHTDVPLEMMQSAHLYDQTYVVLSYIPSSSCYRRIHWDAPRCLLSQSATCGTISWSLFIMSQAFPLRSSKLLVFKIQYIWCYLSLHAQQGLTISTETLLYSPPSPLHHHSTAPPLSSLPSPHSLLEFSTLAGVIFGRPGRRFLFCLPSPATLSLAAGGS